MIVWVNGAFGAGKTVTAAELARRVHGAVVCDPEEVGFGLHRMMPRALRGDFQDLPAWREGVHDVLAAVEGSGRVPLVVVPMTLVDPRRVDEIVGRLRREGYDVRHVALLARPDTLHRRLRSRLDAWRGGETWAMQQVDRCVAGLDALVADPVAAVTGVGTDDLDHDEVVEAVAAAVGVVLDEPRLTPWQARWRRLRVQAGVVRLGL